MSALDDMRPKWVNTPYGALCPNCEEHIGDGTEDYDWGCGTCGYPNKRDMQDWRDQCENEESRR
jgi:hypothetical protein